MQQQSMIKTDQHCQSYVKMKVAHFYSSQCLYDQRSVCSRRCI